MKLKAGYRIDTDVKYVRAIRKAIGKEMPLMVDVNHAYNAVEAIRRGPTRPEGSPGW